MRKPTLNRKLLLKVKKHILQEPRRLDMGFVLSKVPKAIAPCGTQGCIAGWALVLSKKFKDPFSIHDRIMKAGDLLGLTDAERHILFLYWGDTTGHDGAKEAAAKIDLLLKDRSEFVEWTPEVS